MASRIGYNAAVSACEESHEWQLEFAISRKSEERQLALGLAQPDGTYQSWRGAPVTIIPRPVLFDKVEPDKKTASRGIVKRWCKRDNVVDLLEGFMVDLSFRSCWFEALDLECRGELDVNTIVAGIVNLRCPVTKLDIVAARFEDSAHYEIDNGRGRFEGSYL